MLILEPRHANVAPIKFKPGRHVDHEIIGGQADDGAGGRGGEVESAGGARGTVLASGGLITGAEGEDAGEAVLESHPERER